MQTERTLNVHSVYLEGQLIDDLLPGGGAAHGGGGLRVAIKPLPSELVDHQRLE